LSGTGRPEGEIENQTSEYTLVHNERYGRNLSFAHALHSLGGPRFALQHLVREFVDNSIVFL